MDTAWTAQRSQKEEILLSWSFRVKETGVCKKCICRLLIIMGGCSHSEIYSGEMKVDGTIIILSSYWECKQINYTNAFVWWNVYSTAANVIHSHSCLIFFIYLISPLYIINSYHITQFQYFWLILITSTYLIWIQEAITCI